MIARDWKVLGCLLSLSALSLASCAPSAVPAPAAPTPTAKSQAATATPPKVPLAETPVPKPVGATVTHKPAAGQPKYGGILTKLLSRDTPSFDVQREQTTPASHSIFNIYQGLVRFHPIEHSKIVPELAESWDMSPDGKTYTFKFYEGVKWHDGKPFTMEHVKYSLDRMQKPREFKTIAPRSEGMLVAMDKAEIAGSNSVKITTQFPSASFLGNLASGWVAIEPKHVILEKGDMRRDAIGTGPFKFKEYIPNVSMDFVRNPDYYIRGLPYLDGIKFFTITDDATRFAAFRTGQVKMTFIGSTGLTVTQAEIVKREMADKAIAYEHDSMTRYATTFNLRRKPWDDVRVRKAVDLAINRQAAIKVYGSGSLASVIPGEWGMKGEEVAKLPGYRQPKDADLAEAKKLLAEAGYPQGFKTALLCASGGPFEALAVVSKAELAKIGIDVEVVVLERATMDERLQRANFDMFFQGWAISTADPDETLFTYYATGGSRNRGDFSDKEIDDLITKQAQTIDGKARKSILQEIEGKLNNAVPAAIWFVPPYFMGAWKDVKDAAPGPGTHPWGKLDHVWLSK